MTGPLRHRGPAMAEKKTKKMTCITLILLYDFFHEQNGSPYPPLIVRQCK